MPNRTKKPKVMLICLTRRGGLLHFHECFAQALAPICEICSITAKNAERRASLSAPDDYQHEQLATGIGMTGTITKLLAPVTWKRIEHLLTEFQPDIIHITSAQEWNPFLGIFLKTKSNAPLVYTIHDIVHHQGTPFYFRATESLFRRMPTAFVVLTQMAKDILLHKGIPSHRILVVPHGIYDFFVPSNSPSISAIAYEESTKNHPEILFFGRIEPYKGLAVLLEAALQVLPLHPDWRLRIAGNGSLESYQTWINHPILRNQLLIENRFISDEEVAQFMDQAEIVALPYLSATQSGVIPTAFAFEKAVIATHVGGIPEMVFDQETGILVPPNDIQALAHALETLISQPRLRKSLAKAGKQFAHDQLSWASIAEKHRSFYETLLSGAKK